MIYDENVKFLASLVGLSYDCKIRVGELRTK